MVNILRNLKIDEVSSVDKGAGEGVKILLMKRDADIIGDAVRELAGYVNSIAVDKNIVDKDAEIAECISQCRDYLKRTVSQHKEHPMPDIPHYIQKLLDDNTMLAKRLNALEAGGDLVASCHKAVEYGLPETEGVTIQKAMDGDKEAVVKLLGFIKSAFAAARTGMVFGEFGSGPGHGGPATALDELNVLAKTLQASDPKLSQHQAFAKVYEDPANIELVRRERWENSPNGVM
jgi:hypothetical protein